MLTDNAQARGGIRHPRSTTETIDIKMLGDGIRLTAPPGHRVCCRTRFRLAGETRQGRSGLRARTTRIEVPFKDPMEDAVKVAIKTWQRCFRSNSAPLRRGPTPSTAAVELPPASTLIVPPPPLREKSRQAASATAVAAEHSPTWVGVAAGMHGDVYRTTVVSGPYTTRAKCDADLPAELQNALAAYAGACLGSQAGPASDFAYRGTPTASHQGPVGGDDRYRRGTHDPVARAPGVRSQSRSRAARNNRGA